MARAIENIQEVKYVYDLPYTVRKQLCSILDVNDAWEELGGTHLHLSYFELQEIRRAERSNESPTNRLLQVWGQQNHTVKELLLNLWKMQHFQAMRALKSCVPEKYHTLFRDADDHLTGLLMDSKEKKGVVTTEPEQVAMTLGQHTASTAHDTSIRPSITPAASAVPVLYSHEAEQKSSSSLNQNTSDYVHSHQNYNMEGACALDPSHYHNLQTIDEKPSNLNHCCSSKVPVSLLNPTHHHIPSNYASTNHQPPAQNTTALLHNAGGAVSKKTVGCVSTATKPEKIITPHSVVSGPKESSRLPSAADPNKAVYRLPSAANPNKAIYRLPTAANPNKPVCLPTAAIPNKEICRLPTAANPNKPVYLPTAASPNKEIYHLPTAANPNKAIYRLPTAANPNKPVCLPTAANPNKEIYHIPTAASPNKEICRLPTAANPNKPVHLPSATSHEKAPNFLLNGAVERKINNNEGHGTSQEVSCEDNNHEELKSKSIKIPYDPDQDYLNKLEEKRAREAAREAQYRTGGSGSSSASNNSPLTAPYTRAGASPTSPTSPTSPSQQHPQLQQQQQQPPSSRKISSTKAYAQANVGKILWCHSEWRGPVVVGNSLKGCAFFLITIIYFLYLL